MPKELQQRVLLIGVAGALVLRGVFIALGAVLISSFSWTFLLFGGILLFYQQLDSVTLALLLTAFIGYTAWVLNAVWRNAGNVREPIYGEIARFLTVAWSINAVLVSLFLLLAHLQPFGHDLPF